MYYTHRYKLGDEVKHKVAGEGVVVHTSPQYVYVKFRTRLDHVIYRRGGVLRCRPKFLTYHLTLENE